MAKSSSSGSSRRYGTSPVTLAWRTLTWLLLLIIVLAGLNWFSVTFQNGQWTPRLALDLEGGTQVVLEAQLPEGANPSGEQMQQAVSIIRQRIDATGVAEAEITTQGGRNIVVSVPGEMTDAQRKSVEASAKLEFRPVLVADQAANSQIIPPEMLPEDLSTTPTAPPTDPSDIVQVTDSLYVDFLQFNCATDTQAASEVDPTLPLITCDETGTEKFILGPVEVDGSAIADASSGLVTTSTGATTNQWAVNIQFNPEATQTFANITQRLYGLQDPQNRFAVTMDNRVIVAPSANAIITDGKPQITGNFDEASAKVLADQLKFGALPFSFTTNTSTTISATLGTAQLTSGLIAGLIGLILVVLYSIIQYRVLGLVTIASLVFSAGITYLFVTYLSDQQGYRLSLAGVAGLIVAIGITADSFIVYFERIKDELRDGKSLPAAVEAGWSRAIRTILASDAVNFLVALVLFFIAVGNVRGFALTLGITTVIDLVVVCLFTHPLMRLLARSRFFGGGHPASGLDPKALGAVYRGRGTFRTSEERRRGAKREAERRQTLAERKAAAAAGTSEDEEPDEPDEAETTRSRRAASKRRRRRDGGVTTLEKQDTETDVDDELDEASEIHDDIDDDTADTSVSDDSDGTDDTVADESTDEDATPRRSRRSRRRTSAEEEN